MNKIIGRFVTGKRKKDGSVRHEFIQEKFTRDDQIACIDLEDAGIVEVVVPKKETAHILPYDDVLLGEIENQAERHLDFIKKERALRQAETSPHEPEVHEPIDLIGKEEVGVAG